MRTTLTILTLMTVLLSGCHHLPHWGMFSIFAPPVLESEPAPPTHRVFVTPQLRGRHPNRVVLVASGYSQGNFEANHRMIDELATQIRAKGLFEVVVCRQQLTGHADNILQGKFEEREIARISREYNADTVALVRVNELKSFSPLRTAVTVAFIDSNESIISCGIDGAWDLSEPGTQNDFQNYVQRSQFLDSSLPPAVHFQSTGSLFKFAAHEITNSVFASGY